LFIGAIHFPDSLEGMEYCLSCALLPLEKQRWLDEIATISPVSCWHSTVLAASNRRFYPGMMGKTAQRQTSRHPSL